MLDFILNLFPQQLLQYLGYFAILYIIYHSFPIWYGIIMHFTPKKDIQQIYGRKNQAYAVITGSTDGIGQEYAFQFAKLGFNICLIARNPQKLEKTKQKILNINQKIKVVTYEFNFQHTFDLQKVQQMQQFLEKLNTGVFINNVGVIALGKFQDLKKEDIISQININSGSVAVMTNIYLQIIKKQKLKTLIINMSSVSGQMPLPIYQVYAASKAFATRFSQALIWELQNDKDMKNIADLMIVKPGFVKTQMTGGKLGITVEQCVDGVLRQIGKCSVTNGHFIHQIMNYFTELFFLENNIMSKINEIIMNFINKK